ncbi:MAG: hypothetical protein ABH883_05795 [Candidatus Omnitrophota bacterium]
MFNGKQALKYISLMIAAVFFQQQILSSAGGVAELVRTAGEKGQESVLLADVSNGGKIADKFAQTDEFNVNTTGDTIISIQDCHSSLSAQYSIVNILKDLLDNYDVRIVAIEGGAGYIDTSILKSFPVRPIRRKTAEYLMKEGKISAGEFFAATTDQDIALYGVEDNPLYVQNLESFREIHAKNGKNIAILREIYARLVEKEEAVFSEGLNRLVYKARLHRQNRISFDVYWEFLRVMCAKAGIDETKYGNIRKFADSLSLERDIDFTGSTEERKELLSELTRNAGKEDLEEIIVKSLAFEKGRIDQYEYHEWLLSYAEKRGIQPGGFPELLKFTEYAGGYRGLNIIKLQDELSAVEDDILERLFSSNEERSLYRSVRLAELLISLFRIELTESDLLYLRANMGIVKAEFPGSIAYAAVKALRFYDLAGQRDHAMLANTVSAMKREGKHAAALISGGHHSPGLTELMKSRGLSYLVLMPKFLNDKPRPYVAVLTRKTGPYRELVSSGSWDLALKAFFESGDAAAFEEMLAFAAGQCVLGSVDTPAELRNWAALYRKDYEGLSPERRKRVSPGAPRPDELEKCLEEIKTLYISEGECEVRIRDNVYRVTPETVSLTGKGASSGVSVKTTSYSASAVRVLKNILDEFTIKPRHLPDMVMFEAVKRLSDAKKAFPDIVQGLNSRSGGSLNNVLGGLALVWAAGSARSSFYDEPGRTGEAAREEDLLEQCRAAVEALMPAQAKAGEFEICPFDADVWAGALKKAREESSSKGASRLLIDHIMKYAALPGGGKTLLSVIAGRPLNIKTVKLYLLENMGRINREAERLDLKALQLENVYALEYGGKAARPRRPLAPVALYAPSVEDLTPDIWQGVKIKGEISPEHEKTIRRIFTMYCGELDGVNIVIAPDAISAENRIRTEWDRETRTLTLIPSGRASLSTMDLAAFDFGDFALYFNEQRREEAVRENADVSGAGARAKEKILSRIDNFIAKLHAGDNSFLLDRVVRFREYFASARGLVFNTPRRSQDLNLPAFYVVCDRFKTGEPLCLMANYGKLMEMTDIEIEANIFVHESEHVSPRGKHLFLVSSRAARLCRINPENEFSFKKYLALNVQREVEPEKLKIGYLEELFRRMTPRELEEYTRGAYGKKARDVKLLITGAGRLSRVPVSRIAEKMYRTVKKRIQDELAYPSDLFTRVALMEKEGMAWLAERPFYMPPGSEDEGGGEEDEENFICGIMTREGESRFDDLLENTSVDARDYSPLLTDMAVLVAERLKEKGRELDVADIELLKKTAGVLALGYDENDSGASSGMELEMLAASDIGFPPELGLLVKYFYDFSGLGLELADMARSGKISRIKAEKIKLLSALLISSDAFIRANYKRRARDKRLSRAENFRETLGFYNGSVWRGFKSGKEEVSVTAVGAIKDLLAVGRDGQVVVDERLADILARAGKTSSGRGVSLSHDDKKFQERIAFERRSGDKAVNITAGLPAVIYDRLTPEEIDSLENIPGVSAIIRVEQGADRADEALSSLARKTRGAKGVSVMINEDVFEESPGSQGAGAGAIRELILDFSIKVKNDISALLDPASGGLTEEKLTAVKNIEAMKNIMGVLIQTMPFNRSYRLNEKSLRQIRIEYAFTDFYGQPSSRNSKVEYLEDVREDTASRYLAHFADWKDIGSGGSPDIVPPGLEIMKRRAFLKVNNAADPYRDKFFIVAPEGVTSKEEKEKFKRKIMDLWMLEGVIPEDDMEILESSGKYAASGILERLKNTCAGASVSNSGIRSLTPGLEYDDVSARQGILQIDISPGAFTSLSQYEVLVNLLISRETCSVEYYIPGLQRQKGAWYIFLPAARPADLKKELTEYYGLQLREVYTRA